MNTLSTRRLAAGPGTGLAVDLTSARMATACVCVGFVVSWLSPYHTFPYWAFYNDYVSLLAVVLATLVFYGRAARPAADVPTSAFVFIGLAAIVVVDAVTGRMPAPFDAFIPIGYLVAAATTIVLARDLGRSEDGPGAIARAYDWFAMALVFAGLVSAFITFFQYFRVDDLLGDWSVGMGDGRMAIRPFANIGQPNQLALLLCWAVAGLWWLFQAGRLRATVSTVLAVLILFSAVLTQSKVAWLIVPLLATTAAWVNRRADVKRVSPLLIVALVAFFAIAVLTLPLLAEFSGTATESVDKRMETNGVRSVMILEGFYIALQHPLLGVGWSAFGANQVRVAPLFGETQYAMHSHNIVSNLAAELGFPITIALTVATGLWLYRRYIRVKAAPHGIFALMIFIAVGVHSLVEFPLWYAYVLLPVAFLIGLMEADTKTKVRVSLGRNAMVSVALVGSMLMVLVAHDYRGVVQGFRALGYQRLGWDYYGGSTQAPAFTIFPHFFRYFEFADVHPTVNMPAADIARYESVKERFGYAPVLMRMATIYALNHREADAVTTMLALRRLYAQRYAEAYASWEAMAREYPEVLGAVYRQLPPP